MTAPVSQTGAGSRRWRVRFFLPSEYERETLPKPNDPDIAISELPPEILETDSPSQPDQATIRPTPPGSSADAYLTEAKGRR
jgi:hypothetical protein